VTYKHVPPLTDATLVLDLYAQLRQRPRFAAMPVNRSIR
jgi:hypothetical protein